MNWVGRPRKSRGRLRTRKSKRVKNFTVERKNGPPYENERMVWPSSQLGTFNYAEQHEKDIQQVK